MSKRELKQYLQQLNKDQLQDQITDLYTRFKEVKEFYDFAFNPNENKLTEQCKFKISNEYFPKHNKKAKCRRSVAQNYIRHFKRLGVEPTLITDIMLFNIEIAQSYTSKNKKIQDRFCKSILKSFEQAVVYTTENNLKAEFQNRLENIVKETSNQEWFNKDIFCKILRS